MANFTNEFLRYLPTPFLEMKLFITVITFCPGNLGLQEEIILLKFLNLVTAAITKFYSSYTC